MSHGSSGLFLSMRAAIADLELRFVRDIKVKSNTVLQIPSLPQERRLEKG